MVNTAKTPASKAPVKVATKVSTKVPMNAPATRRRLSPSERERQIVEGAVDFFARHGLAAQTRELAAQIGVTHALLYHYFPTKQALIDRVYETVIADRWDPRWEALLDSRAPVAEKLCRFYGEYLAAILTPEWLRVFMYSGMSDGLMPQRYFALLHDKLFPRLLREARRAHGVRSRSKPSAREQALLMGLHGGLVYQLGIVPLCYGQPAPSAGDAALVATFIRDGVQGYLAQVGRLLNETPVRSAALARAA